jgi:fluoride exporter
MIWYIALGGAAGSVLRFLLGTQIQERGGLTFPLGTLIINITGSLLLGFLLRYALGGESISPEVRALLTTGFCGGYTTFSTFSYETAAMLEGGDYGRAFLYVGLSVIVSLMGAFAGIVLARELLAWQRAR